MRYSVKIGLFPSHLSGGAMAIRYAIDLTDAERAALQEILSKNQVKRSTIINAYILRKADRSCGWTNADIASAYDVSTKKVEQLKTAIPADGLIAIHVRVNGTNSWRFNPQFWSGTEISAIRNDKMARCAWDHGMIWA